MAQSTRFLILGAGITGLSFANFLKSDEYLIVEREDEIGGWCRTVKQDGFVWDYSGHFFHFRHADIEAYLRERMKGQRIDTVVRRSLVRYKEGYTDFPFQKNIHQLEKEDLLNCLYDLVFRPTNEEENFEEMLYAKFGRSIAEMFLIPYNEKLYACSLDKLDPQAMGRFFPYADLKDIVANFREADNRSYNATFTYPAGGAIEYVRAMAHDVAQDRILLQSNIDRIDLHKKCAYLTNGDTIRFEHLISSAPFDRLLQICGMPAPAEVYDYNRVLVFNLGFDAKGPENVHWIYYPEKKYSFYRVGFYDNIMSTDRMSLYVEIGFPRGGDIDVDVNLERVLLDLVSAGVVTDQNLIASHSVVLDPAYVHITGASKKAHARDLATLQTAGVYSIGRYGSWTYCSIEDNIVEARDLAERFNLIL